MAYRSDCLVAEGRSGKRKHYCLILKAQKVFADRVGYAEACKSRSDLRDFTSDSE